MALIEQIRGLDSTLGSTKTVVGGLTTKTVSGQGELIQGFNGSSYVYYDGAAQFADGDWSIFGDLENVEGAGNTNTLVGQGGSGSGAGFRFTYIFGTWRFTAGGVADYDFSGVTTPSSGPARWGLTHNSATNKLVFYINGVKAISATDISIGTIVAASNAAIIIGAAWNGDGFSDITGSDSRNVNGNLDIYNTAFDAAQVADEYATYLESPNSEVAESVSSTESISFTVSKNSTISESASSAETSSRTVALLESATESASATSIQSPSLSTNKSATESIDASESSDSEVLLFSLADEQTTPSETSISILYKFYSATITEICTATSIVNGNIYQKLVERIVNGALYKRVFGGSLIQRNPQE